MRRRNSSILTKFIVAILALFGIIAIFDFVAGTHILQSICETIISIWKEIAKFLEGLA